MYLIKELIDSKMSPTDKLFKEVSDYDIYCELIGEELVIGSPIRSPIRDGDSLPSFSIFIPTRISNPRTEEIWWTDFTLGSGNIFDFVVMYVEYHDGVILNSRMAVIKYLDEMLDLGIFDNTYSGYEKRYVDYEKEKETRSIFFNSRSFTNTDITWWLEYAIDIKMLEEHNVRSLNSILNEDFTVKYTYRKTELGFVYVVYDKVKIYSPYGGDYKWRNTCPSHYILGDEQVKKKDYLIITKSLKDIMTFKAFLDVDVIAPQSESSGLSPERIAAIKQQYKKVYVVMDYDAAGKRAAKQLEQEGFEVAWVDTDEIQIGNKTTVYDKDISDYTKHNGIMAGFNLTQKIFPEFPRELYRFEHVEYLIKLKETLSF